MNHITISGSVNRKYVGNGVVFLTLASSRNYFNDKLGAFTAETTWIDVAAFETQDAQLYLDAQKIEEGAEVKVEGMLSSFTDRRDADRRTRNRIIPSKITVEEKRELTPEELVAQLEAQLREVKASMDVAEAELPVGVA